MNTFCERPAILEKLVFFGHLKEVFLIYGIWDELFGSKNPKRFFSILGVLSDLEKSPYFQKKFVRLIIPDDFDRYSP